MVKQLLLVLMLSSGCRIYAPTVLDCQIRCGMQGECPTDTGCRDGLCRVANAKDTCECTTGDVRNCGEGLGLCAKPGTQSCTSEHHWGECVGAYVPAEETCNGLDDDCDGETDENVTHAPACSLTEGVCSSAIPQCGGGTFFACDASRYGPRYERLELSCDGLDNDCDGQIDRRATVELTTHHVGAWWLLPTNDGFVLATEVDGGEVEVQWLDEDLRLITTARAPAGEGLQVASDGEQVRVARRSDGGVVLETRALDGGNAAAFIDDVGAYALSGAALGVVRADSRVELVQQDGGTSLVGVDDGGTLLFSELGSWLAWSGGLANGVNGTGFVGTFSGYEAFTEPGDGVLGGLPRAQPTSGSPVFVRDVLGGAAPLPLTAIFVPSLHDVQATGLARAALLVGIDPTRRAWLVTEHGVLVLEANVDVVRVARSRRALSTVAWSHGPVLSATRICAP